ncbi:MAG: MFS transporter [Acidimicrobiia bacterium]|jgi:MFS family permease|nr:MFS transporter [Acidimicrobiia bacterium]
MVDVAPPPPVDRPLLTRDFVVVTGAALLYFVALGALAPTLPRYVAEDLGGGGGQVGLAVGIFAVSAALLRPWVGKLGDERGRRLLVVGGSLVAGVSFLGYALPGGLPVLLAMRLLGGVGEAAVFVGAATTAQDLAPPHRRGQAASYFSVAIYGGLALGPVLGEVVRTTFSIGTVWPVAAVSCALAAALGSRMPAHVAVVDDEEDSAPPRDLRGLRRFFHPAAVRPGVVLALSASGFAGFSAFVPLYVDDVGLSSSGGVFALYAVVVLGVRIVGSRLPDVLGPRRGPSMALLLQGVGLVAIGAFATTLGLYASAFLYAIGTSLLYPALFPVVIAATPRRERSQAVATFTLFFDVSQAVGAPVLGLVAVVTGERGVFVAAGVLAFVGLVVHRSGHLPAAVASGTPCPPPRAGE